MRDLLIVGAGPAGLSAAIEAAEQGLNVRVIDEFPALAGGCSDSCIKSLMENGGTEFQNQKSCIFAL